MDDICFVVSVYAIFFTNAAHSRKRIGNFFQNILIEDGGEYTSLFYKMGQCN